MSGPSAAIVVIGNEVLSAKVLDENGPFLTRELRALGLEVRRIETVPDETEIIADAVNRCRASADWVFTSGGIGPTHDDVTIAAIARAFGCGVVSDPRSLQLLEEKFGERLNPALRRLAEVPEGARVQWHEHAMFPLVTLERVVILPGVPALLREGFGWMRERLRSTPFHLRAVYVAIGEGRIAAHLDATVAAFPGVSVGSYPRFDGADHRVKITFDGREPAQVEAATADFKARLPEGALVREE
jgi:molybdenum cofactor synthesis domain-containing protein